jgi:hypothetical protein
MYKQGRRMPAADVVRRHWAERLVAMRKFNSVEQVLEAEYCFACVHKRTLQRAHILARAEGGPDDAENLHMLCHMCHKGSELLSGDAYWDWFHWQGPFTPAMFAPLFVPSVRNQLREYDCGPKLIEIVDGFACSMGMHVQVEHIEREAAALK